LKIFLLVIFLIQWQCLGQTETNVAVADGVNGIQQAIDDPTIDIINLEEGTFNTSNIGTAGLII
jgi:hypothetical protein